MLDSEWYQARLDAKVKVDLALWTRHIASLESFLGKPNYQSELKRQCIHKRLETAKARLAQVNSPAYRTSLIGMIGADPALS